MIKIPIGSIYYIVASIYHKIQPNVGKYTSPMDPMGFRVKNHHMTGRFVGNRRSEKKNKDRYHP